MSYIPQTLFANLPQTTVISGGTDAPAGGTVEVITVNASGSFPAVKYGAQQFHFSDPAANSELFTCQQVSGNTWTVIRGAEGTAPVTHAANFTIIQVVSAGDLASLEYPPWQFPVQAYGAVGDGKIGTGGTGTSGTSTFTDAGASFVNATAPAGDVGKYIVINQGAGGSATNPFVGTISAVNSGTSIVLSANLAANAASAPYVYGTDDTTAINAAVSAAQSWAVSTGNYKAQVIFEPQIYMLGALYQTTSPYVYNTHIPVPFGSQYGRKLVIDFIGVGDATEPDYWETAVPSLQGTCLMSASFATSQPNGTYGNQSVIGGPTNNTGLSPGLFANGLVNISGLTVVCPWNSGQNGLDFRYMAQANIESGAYLAFAPVNYSGQVCGGPYLSNANLVTNGTSAGLAMPLPQNNDNCNIQFWTTEGAFSGLNIAEHTTAQRVACIYCVQGIEVNAFGGNPIHGSSILYASVEASGTSLVGPAVAGTQFPLFIGLLDTEFIVTADISDPNDCLAGTVNWADYERTTMTVTGATGLNIVNTRLSPGPWSGAPAAPSSGTAQQNTAFRPAVIYASATTITNTSTGPVSGSQTSLGQTAGASSAVPIRVPSGHWYSVTYTGTLTTQWVLE